jgi:very-short-patch-repair endonuclease
MLARATDLKVSDIELLTGRYRGRRGITRARIALPLVDAGAESPRETWLRLLLIRAGFPPPQTQIPIYEYGALIACLDMGWQEIKLAVEYDGDQHRTDRRQFNKDIRRAESLAESGWTVVRVTAEDTPGGVIGRVSAAWQRRTCTQRENFAKNSP